MKDAKPTPTNGSPHSGKEHDPAEYDLRYTVQREGSAVLLTLRGELDIGASQAVYGDVTDALRDPECKDLITDMSDLTFLDSSGLNIFINVMQLLRGRGGAIYMAGVHPSIRRGLTVTRLDRIFQIFDTIDDAQIARSTSPAHGPA